MKMFLVQLRGAGSTCVEADRYERGEKVIFYHGDTPFANYPGYLVKHVMEISDEPDSFSRFDIESIWD